VKFRQISFVLRRCLKSLKELLWTHVLTCGTMAVTLFIFGGFLLIQENLYGLLKGWGSQIQIFAYLQGTPSPADIKRIVERIGSYPEVESVRFVSKGEAWENFKQALGAQSGVLEGLQANILPASLEIALKKSHSQRASLGSVAERLRAVDGIIEVEYPEEWMEKLSLLVLGVQWAKWVLGGSLFVASLLIVVNTVKLAILARKDEIEIMQLVGAPRGLVAAPFVIEGMIQGIVAASASLLFLWLLFVTLSARLPSSFGILASQDQLRFIDSWGISLLLLLGWAMGAGGSLISLKRFLKTWRR
jgi:cell division transport system permease protein